MENFTPSIVIFSFSFITLFVASLVAKDRNSSFLTRLCISPMKSRDFILGYILSILPVVIIQNILFFITAILMGLPFSINIIYTILVSIPISILFILLGILIGCVTSEKSAAGLSSIVVQLVAFTSGIYFDANSAGTFFKYVCEFLPFSRCVDMVKGILNNNLENGLISIGIIVFYTILIGTLSIIVFNKKRVGNKSN